MVDDSSLGRAVYYAEVVQRVLRECFDLEPHSASRLAKRFTLDVDELLQRDGESAELAALQLDHVDPFGLASRLHQAERGEPLSNAERANAEKRYRALLGRGGAGDAIAGARL